METIPQTSTSAYDHLLKILLVGESKSNKKALLGTYLEDVELGQRSSTTLGEGRGGECGCVWVWV